MANINDYLIWRGDIPINRKFPFNEIDAMILGRLSYLRFDKIKMPIRATIQEISKKMSKLDNEEFRYNGDKELITYLGQSERFKNMVVTDYVENSEKDIEQQFGAITIHISYKEMYISFIGTDSSILGWKEDFNMAFMENVPCQIEGKKYCDRIMKKYINKKVRIGGHSKGGNVAIFSAITRSKEEQKRIIKVYNYDGPGFNKEMIEKYKSNSVIKKIETYFPQDSIIGRIMNHKEKCTVILSTEKGIYQHDIFSWQVLKDDLIKSESLTDASELINETLDNWLKNSTKEQRKIFFDSIFNLFYATEAETFSEISQNMKQNIKKILKTYHEISEQDRKTINSMIKLFIKTYMKAVKVQKTMQFNNMKEYYRIENIKSRKKE